MHASVTTDLFPSLGVVPPRNLPITPAPAGPGGVPHDARRPNGAGRGARPGAPCVRRPATLRLGRIPRPRRAPAGRGPPALWRRRGGHGAARGGGCKCSWGCGSGSNGGASTAAAAAPSAADQLHGGSHQPWAGGAVPRGGCATATGVSGCPWGWQQRTLPFRAGGHVSAFAGHGVCSMAGGLVGCGVRGGRWVSGWATHTAKPTALHPH